MADFDFITDALNVTSDDIEAFSHFIRNGHYILQVTLKNKHPYYPFCGGPTVTKAYSFHSYNHLPIFSYPSVIEWRRRRYKCKDCSKTFSEDNPFGPENFRHSYALLRGIALDLAKPSYSFHDNDMAKYGGSYLCVLSDGFTRQPFEILPNRSKNSLSRYFESIPKEERDTVEYVTTDLWEPYRDVSKKYFKNCIVAADPFHVVKNLIDPFSHFRVSIMNQCVYNSPAYYLLKKWNRLFLNDHFDINDKPKYNGYFKKKMNYYVLFQLLLEVDSTLKKAYELMDDYRTFNRTATAGKH